MTPAQLEQQRIRDYARGFNDAAMGRAPRDADQKNLTYALGYLDASR
jgi:hypothetical protein